MTKRRRLVAKPRHSRTAQPAEPAYRAITEGGDRGEWAVVNGDGAVVYRGEARVAAMIASRLTRPSR